MIKGKCFSICPSKEGPSRRIRGPIRQEVQSSDNDNFRNRSLYYWSKLYSSQLENSQFYAELRPAICINLLDFKLLGEQTPLHNCFVLREKKNPELFLTDNLAIHFLELPKLEVELSNNKLKNWIEYFKKEGRVEDMKTLLEDPDIRKAHEVQSQRLCHHRARPNRPHARTNVYQEFSGNNEFRELYEARMKWKRDYEGRLTYEQQKARAEGREEGMQKGMEKGIEKGREEGKLKEKIETAKEMLKLNMSIDLISKVTGLSPDTIEGLKKEF